MAIALVTNAAVAGANGGTTGAVDTTGANFLVAHVTNAALAAISDSKGGTWVLIATYGTIPSASIYYIASPTVGSGHTFTLTGASSFSELSVAAFSGVLATSPHDQANGASGGGYDGTNGTPGSITPSENDELVVTGAGYSDGTNRTVDSGFTITNQLPLAGGSNYGGGLAYLVQTSAAAVNPLWNITGAGALSIASFKAAAAGGGTILPQMMESHA